MEAMLAALGFAGLLCLHGQATKVKPELVWMFYRACYPARLDDPHDDGFTYFTAQLVNHSNSVLDSLTVDCRLQTNTNGKVEQVFHQEVEVPVTPLEVDPATCELRKKKEGLAFLDRMRLVAKIKAPPEALKAYNSYWIEVTAVHEAPAAPAANSTIFDAAASGDTATLGAMLKARPADVRVRDRDGNTPLHLASLHGRLDAVSVLLQAGADISVRNKFDIEPIHYAAAAAGTGLAHPSLVEPLLQAGANPNALSKSTGTPLGIAAFHDDEAAVKYLIQKGADPNLKAKWSDAVIQAVRGIGGSGCLLAVLQGGGDPNSVNSLGRPALLIAAGRSQSIFTDMLLRAGAKPNVTDQKDGTTALHVAADGGNIDAVKLLLEKGADRSMKDNSGKTALDLARAKNFAPIVTLLEAK